MHMDLNNKPITLVYYKSSYINSILGEINCISCRSGSVYTPQSSPLTPRS